MIEAEFKAALSGTKGPNGQPTALGLKDRYINDNSWFLFGSDLPNPDNIKRNWSGANETWDQYVDWAWQLYKNAQNTGLASIVLGDTKIRSDESLLMNFGLVSNTAAPQEAKDIATVQKVNDQRTAIAAGGKAGPAVNVMGTGSILSAYCWSPLMNDALVIANAERRCDFYYALSGDELTQWNTIVKKPAAQIQETQLKLNCSEAKAMWYQLFAAVPTMLWFKGKPRVFAREAYGLKIFGYEPVFTQQQLGFRLGKGASAPTFRAYLDGLQAAGFAQNNEAAVLGALGDFLFSDRACLLASSGAAASAAAAAPTPPAATKRA